jgi:hypothetical protein
MKRRREHWQEDRNYTLLVTSGVKSALNFRDGYKCWICNERNSQVLQVAHLLPRAIVVCCLSLSIYPSACIEYWRYWIIVHWLPQEWPNTRNDYTSRPCGQSHLSLREFFGVAQMPELIRRYNMICDWALSFNAGGHWICYLPGHSMSLDTIVSTIILVIENL